MSKKQKKEFENIFQSSKIELANEELRLWRDCYTYVHKLIKNKGSLGDITTTLHKEVYNCSS